MIDIAFEFDLQLVENFTRITANSRSILDLFIVNGSVTIQSKCEVLPGISDHHAVLFTLSDISVHKQSINNSVPNCSRAGDVSIMDMLAFEFDFF